MIKIDKKWFIDADKNCYILCKKVKTVNKKTGEESVTDKQIGYFQTVSAALNYYIRLKHRKLVAEQELTLDESIEKYKEIETIAFKTANGQII